MGFILVVDDEKDLCELIVETLELDGHQLMISHSGNEAFKLVQQYQFDLIISDLDMQDGNGLELLKKVQSLHHTPKVIFMTGYSKLSAKELKKRGAYNVFHKPLNFDIFSNSIRMIF